MTGNLCKGLVLALLLSGCAASPNTPERNMAMQPMGAVGCGRLEPDQELVINLVEDMVRESRLHAALANLERLPEHPPEIRLHKARVKRMLGHPDAESLYRTLVDGCAAAYAYHGLGQLAAARGDHEQALGYLRQATRLSPTSQAIRNDLGFVYLHLRRVEEARFELLTALELDESNTLPVENLLTLLIYDDKWREAGSLVQRSGFTPEQFQRAEQRARRLRLEDTLSEQAAVHVPFSGTDPARSNEWLHPPGE